MFEIEFKQNPGHDGWMPFTTVTHIDTLLMEHLVELRTKGHYFRFVNANPPSNGRN